jgi:hypothetical protein
VRRRRFRGKLPFGNLWAELNDTSRGYGSKTLPETAFLQKVSNLLLEYMITNLMTYASAEDQNFEEFRRRTLALMAENQAEAAKVPWVA